MAESDKELKSLLMRVKEKSEKAGLKLVIQKKLRSWHPISSWQVDGEKLETVADFIFLGSKTTLTVTIAMKLKDTCFLERKF